MKLKAYKIRVPELFDVGDRCYTRQEIHELIQKKAVELGYRLSKEVYDKAHVAVCMFQDGSGGSWQFYPDFDAAEEITWQNFLKLTPEDVIGTHPEHSNDIPANKVAMKEAVDQVFNSPDDTERNEKAWELYKDIYIKHYDKFSSGLYEERILKRDCYEAVDEFLKQAGDK